MVTDFSMFDLPDSTFPRKKPRNARLSLREAEVLTWTAEGKTCFEISVMLGIAEETVRTHVKNACQRLNAVNKVQAVAIAMTLSLIAPFAAMRFACDKNIPHSGDSKTFYPATKSKRFLCVSTQGAVGR